MHRWSLLARAAATAACVALLLGCGGEERHDYEAAANELANEAAQGKLPNCHDCEPYNLSNGLTLPAS
jgi:hypothetical protein